MAISQSNLPEGTDSIIPGSASDTVGGDAGFGGGYASSVSGSAPAEGATKSSVTEKVGEAAAKASEATAGLRAQATEKAYGFVAQGKDRAVGLLDNVTQLVDDAAAQIDEKAGEQYGAYARQASQAVAGLADNLRDRDVEVLIDDARDLVRKSPAIAIGAAAAVGFLLARVLKVGLADGGSATASVPPAPAVSPYAPPLAPVSTPSTATTVPIDTAY